MPPDQPKLVELKELIERLTKIAAQVPGVVYQFKLRPDGSSCFPYASERIREIYRVSPQDVLEDSAPVFAVLHPDDFAGVTESITRSAQTLLPWQYEYRVIFTDGEVRWLYGNSLPELQDDGCVLWHGFITDVTERKQQEEAKQNLENQLRQVQKMESIGRLAGGVAHDFNNLLTSVLGYAELTLAELPKDSPASANLQRIMQLAEQGATLTQQLLASARKKVIAPQPVNLSSMLSQLSPLFERLLDTDIELRLQLASQPLTVLIDPGGMEQVIINLLVNVRQAMPEGGTLTITTTLVTVAAPLPLLYSEIAEGTYLLLSVGDTGCGMSAETLTRIFEPFFTTKAVGQGSGLGLAMCEGIIQQAGGHISAESVLGQGSIIHIYLPLTADAGSDTSTSAEVWTATAAASETLLVVEDELRIRELAVHVLQQQGYTVLAASHGVEALELLKQASQHVDLVITDLVMPKMGGKELAAKVRALYPSIRILFTSGYVSDGLLVNNQHEPAPQFLPKPYSLGELLFKVRQALRAV